jgi:uncharacterized protein YdiU (UPF0061 family)
MFEQNQVCNMFSSLRTNLLCTPNAFVTGAVVCRVAPSFLRFGSIEWAATNDENDLVEQYINFTIDNFYPHLKSLSREDRYENF